jgi:hypothetical protein
VSALAARIRSLLNGKGSALLHHYLTLEDTMKKQRASKASKPRTKRVQDLAPRQAAETKGGTKATAESKGQIAGELARFR